MLEVSHLTLTLSDSSAKTPLVRDVSFVVRPNETYALVGESGCGKSLTALSLMRLLPEGVSVQEGSVLCGGRDLFTLTEREMNAVRGAGISLIFQEPATSLNPVIRVGEQIREVLTLHPNVCPDASPEAVSRWLARVGFDDPERIAKSFPHELSGGQKQRVMIAMALAASPSVVVADEPTTALDVTLQAQILDLLRDLKRERHLALLLITHDLALVRHYADRVGLMYAGQILEEAPVKDFFSKPLHPYAAGLLRAVPQSASRKKALAGIPGVVPGPGEVGAGCRFASRCPVKREACTVGPIPLKAVGKDHVVRCLFPGRFEGKEAAASCASHLPGSPVLTLEHFCVTYESAGGFFSRKKIFEAVKDVTLSLRAGETLALVGESGSGKSTLAKTLLRLTDGHVRTSGVARIGNLDVMSAHGRALQDLHRFAQIVFQDPFSSFDPRMSVGACIAEGITALGVLRDQDAIFERVGELLETVGLTRDAFTRLPHEFSGGQRQRLALARALAVSPKVIILDEPTSALDVSVQAQILNLLRDVQRKTGVAYLFITHNFAVVEWMADRVAVMKDGRIVEEGTAQEVLCRPKEAYTKALLASVPRL